jgi:hypothetical protein
MEPKAKGRIPSWAVFLAFTAGAVVLALVATVALALFLRGERRFESARGEPVMSLQPASVARVRLRGRPRDVSLVRSADGWAVEGEACLAVPPEAVRAVLEDLAALRRRVTSALPGQSPAELSAYGLEKPRLGVEVVLDGGQVLGLALGADTGQDGGMFVRTPRGEIALIAASAGATLEVHLAALRKASTPPPEADPPRCGGG